MARRINELLKTTKRLTLCAIFAALGTVIMWFGSLTEILDLSSVAVAAVLNIVVVIEYGKGWPWSVYAVTGFLAILLLPSKSAAIMYLIFGGYYPMIKEKLERLRPWLSWTLKFVAFNIAFVSVELISVLILKIPFEGGKWMIVALAAAGNIAFGLFDYVLTRLISLYIYKFRDKFKFIR